MAHDACGGWGTTTGSPKCRHGACHPVFVGQIHLLDAARGQQSFGATAQLRPTFGAKSFGRWRLHPRRGHVRKTRSCLGVGRGCLFRGNGSRVEGGGGLAHCFSSVALRCPFCRFETRFRQFQVRKSFHYFRSRRNLLLDEALVMPHSLKARYSDRKSTSSPF
jgi:hypothetical protein